MNFNPNLSNLTNGINLITLNIPTSTSVTALLMVKVGSRYEADNIAGISHFVEHMVFKGTQKYPTPLDISTAADSVGAEMNAFTSKEYTGFYVKSASNHLDLALDIISQLVWHAKLPAAEITKEKGVIIEEINMREDMPMAKVGENFEVLLYDKTHLGRDVIGFKETVSQLEHQDFVDYMAAWYKPQRMVIAAIGGTQMSNVKCQSLVEKYFNRSNRSNRSNDPEKLTFIQQKPALQVEFKKTEQTHLCLGVRTFPRGHKDRYVLTVLATILGGNMSSRLFTEVREKRGLAYYIKSDITTYVDNGYLMSQAGCDINKASEVVKVIINEYQKVSEVSKVSEAELNRAKEFLKGKLALAMEDSKNIASFYTEDLLMEGRMRAMAEIIKGIESVTVGDIIRVARLIFANQGLNLAVIGPYKDESGFEKLMKI